MTDRRHTRRRYLLAAGTVALAGCSALSSESEPSDGDADDTPTEPPTESPTEPPTGATSTATPTTTASTPSGPYGGWFADTANFDGTTDLTGQSSVTVAVGAEGNDGPLAFAPAAIRVSQGATVTWKWTGAGGRHNVRIEEAPDDTSWQGAPQLRREAGYTHEHGFETPGTYLYFCAPHLPQGMKGAVVVDGSDQVAGGGGTADSLSAELLTRDTETDRTAAVAGADAMVAEGVPYVCGPAASSMALSAYENVLIPNGVVGCTPSAVAPQIGDLADDDYVFRTAPALELEGRAMAEIAGAQFGDRVAVLYGRRPYGGAIATGFRDAFDGTVTAEAAFESGQSSYRSLLVEALDGDLDALVLAPTLAADGITLLRNYYDLGDVDTGIVVPDSMRTDRLSAEIDADLGRVVGTSRTPSGPGRDAFVDLYESEYGAAPGLYCEESYDAAAVGLLANAAAGANEGPAIREQLRVVANPPGKGVDPSNLAEGVAIAARGEAVNYRGAGTLLNFDPDGELTTGTYSVWRIGTDGAPVEVATIQSYRDDEDGSGPAAADSPGGFDRTLRIGALLPETGTLDEIGTAMLQAARLPVRQVNGEL